GLGLAAVAPWVALALATVAVVDLTKGSWRLSARVRLVVEEAAR
ncbi:MAG: hypothetical protein QOG99_26, partial [Frankiales bacterium]|nr:hypothetical protein [Frankiales bacterium]